MAVKIYADAGSNLFKVFLKAKKVDITVVGMTLDVEGKEYVCYEDEIDVDKYSKDFYDDLSNGANVKTSLINPARFMASFQDDIDAGNEIICFTMASGISGTYQSAVMAAEMINDEVGKEVVHIIDSKTAGFGEGMQAVHAAKLVKKGLSFDEITIEARKYAEKVNSEFVVGDIRFLAKTGRVSALVAKIASVLNIRPILKGSKEATIVMARKVHGKMAAIKSLAEQCIKTIKDKAETVYITHCDNKKDAEYLKELLQTAGIKNIEIYYYDLVTGSHVGPGTVALFYEGANA